VITRVALTGVVAYGASELWKHRHANKVEALVGVLLGKPVMYNVAVEQVPTLRMYGDGGRVIGSTFLGSSGIHIQGKNG
jgi:hypothetical protein